MAPTVIQGLGLITWKTASLVILVRMRTMSLHSWHRSSWGGDPQGGGHEWKACSQLKQVRLFQAEDVRALLAHTPPHPSPYGGSNPPNQSRAYPACSLPDPQSQRILGWYSRPQHVPRPPVGSAPVLCTAMLAPGFGTKTRGPGHRPGMRCSLQLLFGARATLGSKPHLAP